MSNQRPKRQTMSDEDVTVSNMGGDCANRGVPYQALIPTKKKGACV